MSAELVFLIYPYAEARLTLWWNQMAYGSPRHEEPTLGSVEFTS